MKVLSFNQWLEKYELELLELPEDADLNAIYEEYVANTEEAILDSQLISFTL